MLRRIFEPKREEMVGDWRKLHDEELHNLYVSPSIVRVIMSRRMIWAEHAACMRDKKCIQNYGWKCLMEETTQKI